MVRDGLLAWVLLSAPLSVLIGHMIGGAPPVAAGQGPRLATVPASGAPRR